MQTDRDFRAELDALDETPTVSIDTEPAQPLTQTGRDLVDSGVLDRMGVKRQIEEEEARETARRGSNPLWQEAEKFMSTGPLGYLVGKTLGRGEGGEGTLGTIGLNSDDDKLKWIADEKVSADRSLAFWDSIKKTYGDSIKRYAAPVLDYSPQGLVARMALNKAGMLGDDDTLGDQFGGWLDRKTQEGIALAKRRRMLAEEMEAGTRAAPKFGAFRSSFDDIQRGLSRVIAGGIKGVAYGLETGDLIKINPLVDGFLVDTLKRTGYISGNPSEAQKRNIYRFGAWIENEAQKNFPEDEARANEFRKALSEGVGSMIAFMGAGYAAMALGKGAGVATIMSGMTGGLSQAGSMTDDALKKYLKDAETEGRKLTPEEERKATQVWLMGLGIGATEAVPLASFFAGHSGRFVRGVLLQATEEGGQEWVQQVLENVVAQRYYDPERKWDDNAWEGLAIGGILGSSMQASQAAIDRRRGKKPEEPPKVAPPAKAEERAPDLPPMTLPDVAPSLDGSDGGPAPKPKTRRTADPDLDKFRQAFEAVVPSQPNTDDVQTRRVLGKGLEEIVAETEPNDAVSRIAGVVSKGLEQGKIPTMAEVMEVLPKDERGDPDMGRLVDELEKFGARAWNSLNDDQRRQVYEALAPVVEEVAPVVERVVEAVAEQAPGILSTNKYGVGEQTAEWRKALDRATVRGKSPQQIAADAAADMRARGLQPPANAGQPDSAAPTDSLRQSFNNVLNSKAKRSEWQKAIGATKAQLDALVNEALADGRLKKTKAGGIARTGKKVEVKGSEAPAAGQSWASPQGRRTIERIVGDKAYILTEGNRLAQILPISELASERRRDEANVASRARNAAAKTTEEAAQTAREATDGFAEAMPPMQRARAVAALTQTVMNDGRSISRRDLVREMVARGAVISATRDGTRILQNPDESFLDERQLTKTGIDYAAHLIATGQPSGQAQPETRVEPTLSPGQGTGQAPTMDRATERRLEAVKSDVARGYAQQLIDAGTDATKFSSIVSKLSKDKKAPVAVVHEVATVLTGEKGKTRQDSLNRLAAAKPSVAVEQAQAPAEVTPQPETAPAQPTAQEVIEAFLEKKVRIEDAGEKIGGARKDTWAGRGLNLEDLVTMSNGEQAKYVTKDGVWPKPDYAAMVDAGMPAEVAALVKLIRDGLAAKPKVDTPDGRRAYVTMMGHVRSEFEKVRSVEDISKARDRIVYELVGWPRGTFERGNKEQSAVLFSVFKGRREALRPDGQMQRKARQMVADGFPGDVEPWTRRFSVRRWPRPDRPENYMVLNKQGRMQSEHPSEAEAKAAAKALYEAETAKASDEPALPERPHLDNVVRTGKDIRGGRDVDGNDFLKDFGFRGIEFGNWVASDERQKVVNLAYDALHDMANVLGIPPRAVSLNGSLGLAFGARGSGKFLAHYEPAKLVINMTKLRGAGSLAHEWAHALDHYFGELNRSDAYQGQARGASGWYDRAKSYSGQPLTRFDRTRGRFEEMRLANIRPEMSAAFDGVMEALFNRDRTQADVVRDRELALERAQSNVKITEQRLATFEASDAKAQERNAQYGKSLREYLVGAKERVALLEKALAEARGPEFQPSGKVDSSFFMNAKKLSGKQAEKGYWARPTEMFARSFESYVFDKVAESGGQSDYLAQGVEGDRYSGPEYKGNPYPDGVERDAINAAFERLFDAMESTPEGALYSLATPTRSRPFSAAAISESASRRNARTALESGRTYKVPTVVQEEMRAALRAAPAILPDGSDGAFLTQAVKRKDGSYSAVIELTDGSLVTINDLTLDNLIGSRALFLKNLDQSYVIHLRYATIGKDGVRSIARERWHEAIHALYAHGALNAADWRTLVNHAKSLRVLEMKWNTYLDVIGDAGDRATNPETTLLEIYYKEYSARMSKDKLIDALEQEYVAYMTELLSMGVDLPLPDDVRSVLRDIETGAIQQQGGMAEVEDGVALAALHNYRIGRSVAEPEKLWFWQKPPTSGTVLMFHATNRDFDKFDLGKASDFGVHFGTAEQAANRISNTGRFDGARTIPAEITLNKAIVMDDVGYWGGVEVAEQLRKLGYRVTDAEMGAFQDLAKTIDYWEKKGKSEDRTKALRAAVNETNQLLSEKLNALGIDGIWYRNTAEGKGWSLTVWNRGQVANALSRQMLMALGPQSGPLFAFGGMGALTANLGALDKAKAMEAAGTDARSIHKETGWFKRADGWRFEIDDSQIAFNPRALVPYADRWKKDTTLFSFRGRLDQLLSAADLFAAYPQLRNVSVNIGDSTSFTSTGSFSPTNRSIQVATSSDIDKIKSTLLHEIQHAIQVEEGFDGGGNDASLASRTQAALFEITQQIAALPAGSNVRGELERLRNNLRKQSEAFSGGISGFSVSHMGIEAYRRILGEVEARNVETRMNMDAAARAQSFPLSTEDVDASEQYSSKDLVRLTPEHSKLTREAIAAEWKSAKLPSTGYVDRVDNYGSDTVTKYQGISLNPSYGGENNPAPIAGRLGNISASLEFRPEAIAAAFEMYGGQNLLDHLKEHIAYRENGPMYSDPATKALVRIEKTPPQKVPDTSPLVQVTRLVERILAKHPELASKPRYVVTKMDPDRFVEKYAGETFTQEQFNELKESMASAIRRLAGTTISVPKYDKANKIVGTTPKVIDEQYVEDIIYDFRAQGVGHTHGIDQAYPEAWAELEKKDKDLVARYRLANDYLAYASNLNNVGLSASINLTGRGSHAQTDHFSPESQDRKTLAKHFGATRIEDIGPDDPHPGRVLAFHGTDRDLEGGRFDLGKAESVGIHFGTSEQAYERVVELDALKLADTPAGEGTPINNLATRTIPAILDLKNIITLPDLEFWSPPQLAREIEAVVPETAGLGARMKELGNRAAVAWKSTPPDFNQMIRDALSAQGIDGIRYRNTIEGEGWSYIVWEPGKVISATSGNMLFALGGGSSSVTLQPMPPVETADLGFPVSKATTDAQVKYEAAKALARSIEDSFSSSARRFLFSHPPRFLRSAMESFGGENGTAEERAAVAELTARKSDVDRLLAAYRDRDEQLKILDENDTAAQLAAAGADERPADPAQRVYHGSPEQFTQYSGEEARKRSDAARDAGIDVAFVTPVKDFAARFGDVRELTLEPGFYFDPWDQRDLARLAPHINKQKDAGRFWKAVYENNDGSSWGFLERADTLKELQRLGYDGVKMREEWYDANDRKKTSPTIAVFSRGKLSSRDSGQMFFALGSGISDTQIDEATGQSMRRDLDSLGFYSKALEAARGLKQEKGTPEQMMAQLKKAGVKDAEIAATGLDKLFRSRQDAPMLPRIKSPAQLGDVFVKAANDHLSDTLAWSDTGKGLADFDEALVEAGLSRREGSDYWLNSASLTSPLPPNVIRNTRGDNIVDFTDLPEDVQGQLAPNGLPSWVSPNDLSALLIDYDADTISEDAPASAQLEWKNGADAKRRFKAERQSTLVAKTVDDVFSMPNANARAAAFKAWLDTNGINYTTDGYLDVASAYFYVDMADKSQVEDPETVKVRFADHLRQSGNHAAADFNIVSDAEGDRSSGGDEFRRAIAEITKAWSSSPGSLSLEKSGSTTALESDAITLSQNPQQQGDRTASPPRRARLNQITRSEIISHLEENRVGLRETYNNKYGSHSLDPSNPTYRVTVLQGLPGQTPEWRDGHFFDVPNYIAHMQTSMVKHEGRDVFLIDQLQSGLGQALRDQGGETPASRAVKVAKLEAEIAEARAAYDSVAHDKLRREILRLEKVAASKPSLLRSQAKIEDAKKAADRLRAEWQIVERGHVDQIGRLEGELWAAKNGTTPGHPLVNTTDQWTTTTLRRAIRQAIEAGADYIAIPTGDTVLSYNPGDTAGMRGFYGYHPRVQTNEPALEGIVPKNLRKLLSSIDKSSPSPARIDQLETPSGMKGEGFTLFPLTERVKDSVLEYGQPMFAFSGMKAVTARLDELDKAKKMADDGHSRADIWFETGWFKHDGRWFEEKDDRDFARVGVDGKLSQVASHPTMFKDYPELGSIPVGTMPAGGKANASYTPKYQAGLGSLIDRVSGRTSARINITRAADKESLLEEIQHAIDDIEGGFKNVDPKNPYGGPVTADSPNYVNAPFEQLARAAVARMNMTPEERRARPPWLDFKVQKKKAGKTKPAAQEAPAASATWFQRDDGVEVLPERAHLEDVLSKAMGKPIDKGLRTFIDGMKGENLTPETAGLLGTLTSLAESIAAKDPASPWAQFGPAVEAYRAKAQLIGHNQGPATTEWDSPFIYSLNGVPPVDPRDSEDTPSLNKIIQSLKDTLGIVPTQTLLGVTIKAGDSEIRLNPRGNVRGQTQMATGAVGVRKSRAIDVISHEAAHYLETTLGAEIIDLQTIHAAELALVNPAATPSEQWAEWFADYMLDPVGASVRAPLLHSSVEDILEANGMLEGIHETQDLYQQWLERATPEELASDVVSIHAGNSFADLRADRPLGETIPGRMATAYTNTIDDLNPLSKIVRKLLAVADRNGVVDEEGRPISLKVADNPYKIARMFRGSYATGYSWLTKGIANRGETSIAFAPLSKALETLFGSNNSRNWDPAMYQAAGQYLISRRAIAEYDRLEQKQARLEEIDGLMEQGAEAWRQVSLQAQDAATVLERRETALVRQTALMRDRRNALKSAEATVARLQERIQDKKDDVTAAQMARDANLTDRRRRDLAIIERDSQRQLRQVEGLIEEYEQLSTDVAMLEAEIDQLRQRNETASEQLAGIDEAMAGLRREREATEKRGASRAPTRESKEWHQEFIAKTEADPKYARIKDFAALVAEFGHGMLTLRHQAGLISDELFEELSKRKDWFVPFQRDMSDASPENTFFRGAGVEKWSPFKKFDGSDRAIINPLETMASDAYSLAQQIAFNDATNALAKLAERAGEGGASIVQVLTREESAEANAATFDRIKNIAMSMGIDEADALRIVSEMEQNFAGSELSLIWSPATKGPVNLPTVPLYRDGERIMVRFTDPEFGIEAFNAMSGMGKETAGIISEILGYPSRLLQQGVTTHPTFIPRNVFRDIFDAWIKTGALPIVTQARGVKAMRDPEFMRRYMEAGGITGGRNLAALTGKEKQLDVLDLAEKRVSYGNIALGSIAGGLLAATALTPLAIVPAAAFGAYVFNRVGALEAVESAETMTRLGVAAHAYKRALAHNPSLSPSEAMLEAAFVARDVFDWNRRGSKTLWIVRTVTFLNAQIQGMDSAFRRLGGENDRGMILAKHMNMVWRRENGGNLSADEERALGDAYKTFGRMALYTGLLLSLYALATSGGDDDDTDKAYQDIRDKTKITHSWLPAVFGTDVRLPKAFEWALPANAIEAIADGIRGRNPHVWDRIVDSVYEIAVPPTVPQFANLIVGLSANVQIDQLAPSIKRFLGREAETNNPRQVVGDSLRRLDPEAQFDAWSSQLSIDVAKAMSAAGVPRDMIPSPKKIDFILRTGGYWGQDVQRGYQVLKEAFGGRQREAARISDLPVVAGFTGVAARQSRSRDELFRLVSQQGGVFTTAAQTFKNLIDDQGTPADAERFISRLEPDERTYALLQYYGSPGEKKTHPLDRLKAVDGVANKIRQDIILDRLAPIEKQGRKNVRNFDEKITLNPRQQTQVHEILERLMQAEAWNTMTFLERPAWKGRSPIKVEPILDELRAANPQVHQIYEDRLRKARARTWDEVTSQWPDLRDRILREGAGAWGR